MCKICLFFKIKRVVQCWKQRGWKVQYIDQGMCTCSQHKIQRISTSRDNNPPKTCVFNRQNQCTKHLKRQVFFKAIETLFQGHATLYVWCHFSVYSILFNIGALILINDRFPLFQNTMRAVTGRSFWII